MVGVILAAGNGVRLKESIGKQVCKVLEKVSGNHLIEFALNNLIELNMEKVFIVVGKEGDLIKNTIGDRYKNLKITYVCQQDQRGLINAFMQALYLIKDSEDVLLQLADEVLAGLKVEKLKSVIEESSFDFHCGITFESNQDKIKNNFSVEVEEACIIKKCIEKPVVVTNNLKGTGFCLFRSQTLQILREIYDDKMNYPVDLCDFINHLIANNKTGAIFQVAEKEFNINNVLDLEEAENYLQSKQEI